MLALIKKFLPKIFVAVILEENKNFIKVQEFRNGKLRNQVSKNFEKEEKLLEYLHDLNKRFHFHYTALFLNSPEQGLVPSLKDEDYKDFGYTNMSFKTLALNNAKIYTAMEHVDHFEGFFEESGELDFLYSPFALLYYLSQKEKANEDKITLYAFKHGRTITLMVCKGKEILIGDFKVFESESGLELDDFGLDTDIDDALDKLEDLDNQEELKKDDEKGNEIGKDIDAALSKLDDFAEDLNDDFIDNDETLNSDFNDNEEPKKNFDTEEKAQENAFSNDEHEDLSDLSNTMMDLNEEQVKMDELSQFSQDMELCRYVISSIEAFYHDPKYSGDFINELVIFSNEEILSSTLDFLSSETFLEPQMREIKTLDLILELMKKELV